MTPGGGSAQVAISAKIRIQAMPLAWQGMNSRGEVARSIWRARGILQHYPEHRLQIAGR